MSQVQAFLGQSPSAEVTFQFLVESERESERERERASERESARERASKTPRDLAWSKLQGGNLTQELRLV